MRDQRLLESSFIVVTFVGGALAYMGLKGWGLEGLRDC